jgi:hypothetical protein
MRTVVGVLGVGVLFVACSSDPEGGAQCGDGTVLQGDTCVIAGAGAGNASGADGSPGGMDGGAGHDPGNGGSPATAGASTLGGTASGGEGGSAGAGGDDSDDSLVTALLDCGSRDVTGATVVTDPITQDTTWSGTIHLPNGVSVRNEPVLTIEPGTKIIVGTGATVEFGYQGSHVTVNARGTEAHPIRICGETGTAGYYAGVVVHEGVTTASILRNLLIADGGDDGIGAGLTLDAPIDVQGVQVRNSGGYGVQALGFGAGSSTLIVAGAKLSSVLATASPGLMVPLGSVLTGNEVDAVDVGFESFGTDDLILRDFGVPYRVLDGGTENVALAAPPTITIEPGVEVQVQAYEQLSFSSANVTAIGTAEKPILFRGVSCDTYFALDCFQLGDVGPGGTVKLEGGDAIDLEHVEFRRLGYTEEYSAVTKYYYGAVDISSSKAARLKDVTVTNPTNWGIKLDAEGGFSADSAGIVGTSEQQYGTPTLDVDCQALATLPPDTVVAVGGTRVSCVAITKPLTWPTVGAPFELAGGIRVYNGGHLTLPAGTLLYFDRTGIAVESGGAFTAIGTSSKKVELSGSNWSGLFFDTGSSATLDYVTVAGAGREVYAYEHGANIATRVPITLTRSSLINSQRWGLKKAASDTNDYTATNTFSNNLSGNITDLP